jgi:hypothetical protein
MILDYVKCEYIAVKVKHITLDSFAFIIEEGIVNKIILKNSKDLSFRKKRPVYFLHFLF